ncbi:hypothetical protein [Piscibacillus halophilus]|uniref:hypothetical protein n=1 Tax=Piscibacillus halophilus TaxID=571933 RepID=UPI00158ADC37|nr:hypothetical protein [Piscibacillus halophilus]
MRQEQSVLDQKVDELLESKPKITAELIKYTLEQVQKKDVSPEVHSKKVSRKLDALIREMN